ncbi:MAG: aminoacyl-tRNA hydrolase [Firmicutes bacterium]|nr:aminoacyl-tRNA hydrolase [Bacillota bacterium]
MKIIVGLGNPGRDYTGTRHNVGYEVIAKLAYDLNIDMGREKFKAVYGEGFIGSEKIILVQPITYMNLSGDAVREFVNFYKSEDKDIIVACDDINLPVGSVRIRTKGSDGGQKGLRSIMYQLGYDTFTRIRVGIGEKPQGWDLARYVLSKFTEDEREDIIKGITDAAQAARMIVKDGNADAAMNKFNKKGIGAKQQ